jgi:hypothetical protein
VNEPSDNEADREIAPGVPRSPWKQVAKERLRAFFLGQTPTFWVAMLPLFLLSAALYTRHPTSNFIFDEQEALLANPYVNGKNLSFVEAVHRDFWGLPHDRSVGSYRPLPDMLWRALATSLRVVHDTGAKVLHVNSTYALTPWVFHWCNVILHAANGALLVLLMLHVTKRRGLAWLTGTIFVACAVLTEAVSGVVGTADVMGGLGALLALAALGLPLWAMPMGVFGALIVGLFSKESAIVCVPLVPLAALWLAPHVHPKAPRAVVRSVLAAVATLGALVLYVYLRKRWFPAPLPPELREPLPAGASAASRTMRWLMVWFHQPPLPRDPLNNPLALADWPHRVAGALRVYFRSLMQVVFPHPLSGDYSAPQEPIPDRLFFPASVLGGLLMTIPPIAAAWLWIRSATAARRDPVDANGARAGAVMALVATAMVWIVVSYFPHSNLPVVLPTVRAERFMYFPAIGTSMILACAFAAAHRKWRAAHRFATPAVVCAVFLLVQCAAARRHALDYEDDLAFWRATKNAVPRSAKAHLNYSVMWGARGHLDTRLDESRIAVGLAPTWPMANIYLGDTLCRLHRTADAWPHYVDGFKLAPNDPNLIALSLQCLWDEGAIDGRSDDLTALGDAHPGTWLDYLAKDIVRNGTEHGGVEPKYRPRGYNEGPKE